MIKKERNKKCTRTLLAQEAEGEIQMQKIIERREKKKEGKKEGNSFGNYAPKTRRQPQR